MLRVLVVALTTASIFMLAVGQAASKKPQPPSSATLTASYDTSTQRLSIAGCGYDILLGAAQVTYIRPDGSTLSGNIGIWNDGPATDTHPAASCLDTNYLPTAMSGTWTITTAQAGVQLAETTITIL